MKIIIIFFLFCFSLYSQSLSYIEAYSSKIYFEPPDTNKWELEENEMNDRGVYVLIFKHIPIKDSLGREIQPVMSIIAELVNDSLDVVTYSALKRAHTPFTVEKVLSYEDSCFVYRNVIGYEGNYKKGDIVHKVFVIHMRGGKVGLQVICDSTEGVYKKVVSDMRRFIYNIGIDQ